MIDLATRCLDVNCANFALGCESFRTAHGVFVRNREFPIIYDANHVSHVTAVEPGEIDELMAAAEREFEGYNHRRFEVDFRTPPSFVARLALEGYERDDALLLVLEGELNSEAPEHDVRPVQTESDWRDYFYLKELDWLDFTERTARPPEPQVGQQLMYVRRRKCPPAQYWIAYVDGRPAAFLNSWAGVNGVGQVEDLFTHKEYRRRGLATALIHRCVADCRAKGAGPVIIAANPNDTPKNMYAAMGFGPVVVCSHYLKKLAPAP